MPAFGAAGTTLPAAAAQCNKRFAQVILRSRAPWLDFDAVWREFGGVMDRWSLRQLFGLVLAVFMAVGLSLSVAPAGAWPAKMTMDAMMPITADMGSASHGDCGGCPTKADDAAKAMVCGTMCAAPVLATATAVTPVKLVELRGAFTAPEALRLGRTSRPDPYPPRPSDIG